MIQDSDDSSSSSETSDYLGSDLPSKSYQATSDNNLGPQIQVQILAEKYSKPVPVIAYFDTGAHSTMMNPSVLPPEAWKEKSNEFLETDGQIFITNLVSRKKIGIQFFPSYTLWTHVIGTPLPDKDILIGWDVYNQSKSNRILPTALYSLIQDPSSLNANLRTFLQWFNPLSSWHTELTRLIDQYHLWKMDLDLAAKACHLSDKD
ncbi:hypothetical protein Ddye_029703 [Dipteronia dyeriana]|uniref:Uncharacterized protein n=1 Tax=Dipteronia dyeriana TaxID=168575 RepID=A0AAD9TFP0_9ROSI|nr:hypothetical protein Ddye_029703 [Dipteronia dyeriana]